MDMFQGRKIVIATKHKKELVIAPILERELGVSCVVPIYFDTDRLGTFTGEIERENDPLTTAKIKCALAMEETQCDLGISNEGSFGAHSVLYFVPEDLEVICFIDKKNGIEINALEVSTNTNFDGQEVETKEELEMFANKIGFPSHAIILRISKDDYTIIRKDIFNWQFLFQCFEEIKSQFGKVFAETDMRAFCNPTRMKVIESATKKLLSKINERCNRCDFPGFEITEWVKGLPCEHCNFPTRGIKKFIYTCKKCGYQRMEEYPHGKKFQEARFCDICNP